MFARVRERGRDRRGAGAGARPRWASTIGAETPAEIAVSILGGIIAHHKGVTALDIRRERSSSLEASDGEEAEDREDSDRQIKSVG